MGRNSNFGRDKIFEMILKTIEAKNFRNLSGRLECGPKLNILAGDNGQGKTNWLEAIYVLAATRSFRSAKLRETVRFGEPVAIIRGEVRRSEEILRELQAVIEPNAKAFSVNGKRESVHRYLGQLHAVAFNHDELEVVRGQPENRRRFLDMGIASIYPPYVQTISDHQRVLKQKNALLQNARDRELSLEKTAELLEPWNEQLVPISARIHKARVRYVERLNDALAKRLFGAEQVSIRYLSSLEDKGDLADYENLLAERLRLRVQAEVVAGHSLIGPHRDDLEIHFDGHDLRKYASAGQQRSAFLLLQLANISVYHSQQGEYPLFLLDDIDAELDYKRIGNLLEFLEDKTQTFVTTSKESFVEKFGRGSTIFRVKNGAPFRA